MRDIFSLLALLVVASNLGTLFVESDASVTHCDDVCGVAKEPTFANDKKAGQSCPYVGPFLTSPLGAKVVPQGSLSPWGEVIP
jgi:hypothetical protein